MGDLARIQTERLELTAIDPDRDLDGLYPIFSDPASWWHNPVRRHRDETATQTWLESVRECWHQEGLGYWTVRLRDSAEVIGAGGAQRHISGSWNLLWRIAQPHQHQGYATELGSAGIEAAHEIDAEVPAIAWILAHNEPSCMVARRLGLINCGPRHDPADGRERLAYADRRL